MEEIRTLPGYLKQLRKSHRYRQEDVASHLHISRQTYSHYETGRIKPSLNVLYHLAKLYGISADEILEHIEPSFLEQGSEETGSVGIGEENPVFSEKEFLSCLHNLNEKNRADTLSIMWEIMQAKIMKQEAETAEK